MKSTIGVVFEWLWRLVVLYLLVVLLQHLPGVVSVGGGVYPVSNPANDALRASLARDQEVASRPPRNQRFEYKVMLAKWDSVEAELNRLGQQGWEVVHVAQLQDYAYCYCKRPVT